MNAPPTADIVQFVRLGQRVSTTITVTLPSHEVFDAAMTAAERVNSIRPARGGPDHRSPVRQRHAGHVRRRGISGALHRGPVLHPQRITAPTGPGGPGGPGDRYTDEQRRDFARQVIPWARVMRADEISVEQYPTTNGCVVEGTPGEHPHRIWWD